MLIACVSQKFYSFAPKVLRRYVKNLVSKERFTSREGAMAASSEKAIRPKAAASEADYDLREKDSRKKTTKQLSPTGRLYFKSNFF